MGGVAVSVAAGERVALVGHDPLRVRLARVAAGLEPGRTWFGGRRLGYVPAGRRVFGGLTVAENLAVGAYRDRREKAVVAERLHALKDWFPRLDQTARTLSGGEQQLLVIARALMAAPELLILEDPSAGLGPPAVQRVATALERQPLALLIVDEGLALARRLAGRVVLVEDGRVVLDAPAAEALADERLGLGYITGSSSTA